jgi:hypothetical protein
MGTVLNSFGNNVKIIERTLVEQPSQQNLLDKKTFYS